MRFRWGYSALTTSALAIVCTGFKAGAQTQPTFSEHTVYNSSGDMYVSAHGDFNNDGREDLLVYQNNDLTSIGEFLFLSNGDGMYDAPIQLNSVPGPFYAVGDFNHDGNVDFAVLDGVSKNVQIWQGHGDGTFTHGMDLSTDQNPVALVAADLNHDSCTDLTIVSVPSGPGGAANLQNWLSSCSSSISFNAGQYITSGLIPGVNFAASGDFDGDGKPDLILVNANVGSAIVSTVQVWFGDGRGNLSSPTQLADPNGYHDTAFSVGDVDDNGTSDLLFRSEQSTALPQIGVVKGNTKRTLSFQSLNVPSGQCPGYAEIADVNGDGLNDIVYTEGACVNAQHSTVAALLATSKGVFSNTEDTIRTNAYNDHGLTVLKSTQGTKPDIFALPDTAASATGTFPPNQVVLLENSTSGSSFPGCGTTNQGTGINVCTPSGATGSSPVKFSISTAGSTPMRTVAVWADGQKVSEQLTHAFSHYSFLDQSVTLSAGTHSITIYGTGWDNALLSKSFSLNVEGSAGCAAPSSPGVTMCKPGNYSNVPGSPVEVQAAANITGTLARMEIWVDGVKEFTETTSTSVDTSLAMSNGTHKVDVYAANTAGNLWETTAWVTVGWNGCAAPSSYGMNVCTPANNSTVSSPVRITATANIPGTLARMEIWANGQKMYTETTSNSLDYTINFGGPYQYQLDIYAVNTQGTKYETTVHTTVQ